jgi:hypothetical protein
MSIDPELSRALNGTPIGYFNLSPNIKAAYFKFINLATIASRNL